MLIVTGLLGKEMYDDRAVALDVIMKELDVPKLGKYAEFRLAKSRHKTVMVDNLPQERHTRALSLTPVFTLDLPTGTLQIRYTSGRKKKNNEWDYDTKRLEDFRGTMLAFSQGRNLEKYIWYYLYTGNLSNPHRTKGKPGFYEFVDREEIAKKELAMDLMLAEVTQEIMGMDEESLRVMAKGLRYNIGGTEHMIERASEAGIQELRSILVRRCVTHSVAFLEAWRNGGTTVEGMLRHVSDSGKIVLRDEMYGGKTWIWNDGIHDGSIITSVRKNEDPMGALKAAFSDNYNDLMPLLQTAVSGMRVKSMGFTENTVLESVEDLTLAHIKAMGLDQIVDRCISGEIIYFDRATGNLHLIEKGDIGEEIFRATSPTAWKAEFLEALKTPEYNNVKQSLAMRLMHHMKPKGAGSNNLETADTKEKNKK